MFLPRVFHRGVEERFFARILVGVREGFLPTMIRVFGRAGTGKTVVVRSVFERFSKFMRDVADVVKFYYVNLRGCRSVFSAANAVLSGLCSRKLPNNVGLDKFFDDLDERVKSSMGSEVVNFPTYKREELKDILAARAEESFKHGALGEGVIDLCADLVSKEFGDARRAVDLLRVSGEVAAESKSSVVTREHVQRAWERANRDWVREMIMDLPKGHKVVLAYIAVAHLDEEYVTTGEAYGYYKEDWGA